MQRQTAGALGVALAGTLAAALATPAGPGGAFAHRVAFLALASLCLCASFLALRVSDRQVREGYGSAPSAAHERPSRRGHAPAGNEPDPSP